MESSSSAEHREWLDAELDAVFTQAKSPNADYSAITRKLTELIKPDMVSVYGKEAEHYDGSTMQNKIEKILAELPDHDLRNKNIVEPGCGTIDRSGDIFEPWLCRFLSMVGAKPVGIDIGNLHGEPYEHHQQDLLQKDSLGMLKDESADIVITGAFFDSPHLHQLLEKRNETAEDLRRILFPQIQRILKPQGFYINETFHTNTENPYLSYRKTELDNDEWTKREINRLQDIAAKLFNSDPSSARGAIIGASILALEQFIFFNKSAHKDFSRELDKHRQVFDALTAGLPDHDVRGKKIINIVDTEIQPDKDSLHYALNLFGGEVSSIRNTDPMPGEKKLDVIIVNLPDDKTEPGAEITAYAKSHLAPGGLFITISPVKRTIDRTKYGLGVASYDSYQAVVKKVA